MHTFSTAATPPSSERSEEIIRRAAPTALLNTIERSFRNLAENLRNVGGTSGAESEKNGKRIGESYIVFHGRSYFRDRAVRHRRRHWLHHAQNDPAQDGGL